jgi:shikimate kinase
MIVLVGFMGAGKTTVGRLLAGRLGLEFADSDLVIEQRYGRSVRQIFAEDGEAVFRVCEQQVIAELMGGPDAVVAVGGGAVEHQGSRRLLRAATVVYLRISYAEALARVGGDPARPLLRRPDVEDVYRRRLPVYESVAALTVSAEGRAAEAVCRDVLGQLVSEPEAHNGHRGPDLPPGRRAGYPR